MNYKCNLCKRTASQPLNLRCDHHPCYQCAVNIMSPDPASKIEPKFLIVCPTCSKKTVFYDIRHLILTQAVKEDQDEQLFVTDRFLSLRAPPKAKPVLTPRGDNLNSQQSASLSRRGSIQSIANNNKNFAEVRCLDHNEVYKYFCVDCSQNGLRKCLACPECAKPHYSNGHRLLTVKQAEPHLTSLNTRNQEEILVKTGEINFMSQTINRNIATIQDHFQQLEKNLTQQVQKVIQSLNINYQNAIKCLNEQRLLLTKQHEQRLEKLRSHHNILQSLRQIDLKDLDTNLKFYQTYEKYFITTHLSQIKIDLDVFELPVIHKKIDNFSGLAADWLLIGQLDHQKGRSRRGSNLEEQISQRSARDKENRKLGVCQINAIRKPI